MVRIVILLARQKTWVGRRLRISWSVKLRPSRHGTRVSDPDWHFKCGSGSGSTSHISFWNSNIKIQNKRFFTFLRKKFSTFFFKFVKIVEKSARNFLTTFSSLKIRPWIRIRIRIRIRILRSLAVRLFSPHQAEQDSVLVRCLWIIVSLVGTCFEILCILSSIFSPYTTVKIRINPGKILFYHLFTC